MKLAERQAAIKLRLQGHSIKDISMSLGVSKSSVSIWVRNVELSAQQRTVLDRKSYSKKAIESRRKTRLANEYQKRQKVIKTAEKSIPKISNKNLWLMGVMLYWAEGGKTQRMVRFSNGDPEMIKIMMAFFRRICHVPESKFRGYIHIHPHLNHLSAEKYWSDTAQIPLSQFFKTYKKPNKSSQNKRNSLPHGTLDVYVLDTNLFYKITGWAEGIFSSY